MPFSPELSNVISTIGSAIVAGAFTYWAVKYKTDKGQKKGFGQDDFQKLVEANTDFREELRKDLALAKEEANIYRAAADGLKIEVLNYKTQIIEMAGELSGYKTQIVELMGDINGYKEEIKGLMGKINDYEKEINILTQKLKNEK